MNAAMRSPAWCSEERRTSISQLSIRRWTFRHGRTNFRRRSGCDGQTLERAADAAARKVLIKAFRLAAITGRKEDDLVAVIEDRVSRLQSPERNLRWEEYQQFVQHRQPFGENTEFEIRPSPAPPELRGWLESVTRATRLREVRALRGFTRVFPPTHDDDDRIAKISLNQPNWLPAVENRGEGIFVQLKRERLRYWEHNDSVRPPGAGDPTRVRASLARSWWPRPAESGYPETTLDPQPGARASSGNCP